MAVPLPASSTVGRLTGVGAAVTGDVVTGAEFLEIVRWVGRRGQDRVGVGSMAGGAHQDCLGYSPSAIRVEPWPVGLMP